MNKIGYTCFFCLIGTFIVTAFGACQKKISYKSPDGYDFKKPIKHILPERLNEISGIAFLNGNAGRFYAVNDEEGKLYYFNLTDKKYPFSKFSGKGDYEDLSVLNDNRVVVLKSDGSLYLFAADAVETKEIKTVKVVPPFLPKGEYEGIAGEGNSIFVLCKHCTADAKSKQLTIYEIALTDSATPKIINTHLADLSSLKKKQKFNPSCIAKNLMTGEWFILSATNKMLVILDAAWKFKDSYPLDPSVFRQPEGMAFNSNGDLYISNEAGEGTANILKFTYKGK